MSNKVRFVFAVFAAMLCVCALAACNRKEENVIPPSTGNVSSPQTSSGSETAPEHTLQTSSGGETAPEYTQATTEQTPVGEDIKETDTAEEMPNIMDMSNSQLVAYLLSEVPEAQERVTQGGMDALVTEETTELGGVCRDIWLGTDLDGKFTREILYTISASGRIYEYDPLEDAWQIRNKGVQTQVAYVKLDEVVSDEFVQLLIDGVQWVDDNSKPNGYAIYNETEDWTSYIATIWTDCYIWVNAPDVGMELYKVSLDNFLGELDAREGIVLADITIDNEGSILSISERYTP